jgi:hypothetical protein
LEPLAVETEEVMSGVDEEGENEDVLMKDELVSQEQIVSEEELTDTEEVASVTADSEMEVHAELDEKVAEVEVPVVEAPASSVDVLSDIALEIVAEMPESSLPVSDTKSSKGTRKRKSSKSADVDEGQMSLF